jgi:hypothetical protein
LCCLRRWGRFDKDKEIVLAAVARHGAAFAFASADLKADPEVLLVAVEQDATAKLLQPVLVLADGVEEAYPPFDLLAGEKYQLPNLEMDPNEGPNYWIIKENDEIVLTIMIHVEN